MLLAVVSFVVFMIFCDVHKIVTFSVHSLCDASIHWQFQIDLSPASHSIVAIQNLCAGRCYTYFQRGRTWLRTSFLSIKLHSVATSVNRQLLMRWSIFNCAFSVPEFLKSGRSVDWTVDSQDKPRQDAYRWHWNMKTGPTLPAGNGRNSSLVGPSWMTSLWKDGIGNSCKHQCYGNAAMQLRSSRVTWRQSCAPDCAVVSSGIVICTHDSYRLASVCWRYTDAVEVT